MNKTLFLILLLLVNSALLCLASLLFPLNYVLGTATLSALTAAIVSGILWTFIIMVAVFVGQQVKIKELNKLLAVLYYITVNYIALWLLARFPYLGGFGVSRFTWVAALAFIATFAQWGAWELTAKSTPKKEE